MTKGLLDFLAERVSTLPEETIHIKEWGRDVTLRGLTSRERDLFEEENLRRATAKSGNGTRRRGTVEADLANFRARLVARHIVEGGQRTFANVRGEEVLGEESAAVIDPLFAAAQRLSGFSAQDIEELTKNSDATDAEGPSSDSRASSAAPSRNSNVESAKPS
jgi:hypothetical protein